MAEKDVFYVGVHNPEEVRKDVLVSIKGVITSLKRYEQFRMLREEKTHTILELRKMLGEIATLNRKLKSAMPKTGMKLNVPVPREAPVEKAPVKKETPKPKAPSKSKLDVLEDELSKIESRLRSLE